MCYVYSRQIQPGVPLWGPHSDTLGFFWRHPWRVIQDYKGFCCASSSSLLSWNIKPLIPSQNLRFFHPLECNRCLAIRFLWLWSLRFLATLNKAFLRSNFPLLCQIPDLIYNRHSINICGEDEQIHAVRTCKSNHDIEWKTRQLCFSVDRHRGQITTFPSKNCSKSVTPKELYKALFIIMQL